MELIDFYRAVLPEGGRYILFQNKRHTSYPTLETLTAATAQRLDTQGLYFATAAFGDATNDTTGDPSRAHSNVTSLAAHRIDIDAGDAKFASSPNGAYPTQDDAIAALVVAIRGGLPKPTLIVKSGEGLHCYWSLTEAQTPMAWKPAAVMLNAAGKALNLKIDAGCTADVSRVLRPVGTLHKNGKRVEVLRNTGARYDNASLLAQLTALVPEAEAFELQVASSPRSGGINDDILSSGYKGPPASLVRVAEHCAAVAEMRDTHGNIPEPHWRAVIGIAKYCDDGQQVFHEWSSGYAGYDAQETQQKMDRWETPPSKCTFFGTLTDACKGCKYRGQITTPKELGYVAAAALAEPAPIPDAETAPAMGSGMALDDADEVGEATAACPVPTRPDLFDESKEFFYRERDSRWVLMHRAKVITKDATGQSVSSEIIKPVCHKLIWVDSNSLPGASETDGVLIQFGRVQKPGSTRQDRFDMPAGVCAADDTLAKFLIDQGINLDPSNKDAKLHVRRYVTSEIIRKQNDMRFVIKDRFGYHFHEGMFLCSMGPYTVYPDGQIMKTVCNTKLVGLSHALTVNCLPPKPENKWGDDGWQPVVAAAGEYVRFIRKHYGYDGYENARLALSLALASPLLVFTADAPFNEANELPAVGFVVSMYSTASGTGKSSLQEVVAAAYGKPELKRSGKKASMTDVAAATLAKSMGVYPFILDEVTQNDAGQAAALIDTFANGAGRVRARSDGSVAKSAETWALISLLSTNVPQRELIAQSQKRSDALQLRLLELNFDNLKASGDQDAFSSGLKAVSVKCGAFGLLLARMVTAAGPEQINAMSQANLKRAYTLLGVEQQFRFFARGLAAMLTMNQLLRNSAPFDETECVQTFSKAIKATTAFVEAARMTPSGEVAAMLTHMAPHIIVTRTMTNSPGVMDTVLSQPVRGQVYGREVQEWGVVMIDSRVLAKYCADNQMSAKAFLDGCEASGVLVPGEDGERRHKRRITSGIPSMASQSGHYYTFRTRSVQAAQSGGNVSELRRGQVQQLVATEPAEASQL